jgi:hypothetical protein
MLVTVPPADPLIGVLERAVIRPLASTLMTGTCVPLPMFVWAVVMDASAATAAPGPDAVTSPVRLVIALAGAAAETLESDMTRPLASTLTTGI